MADAKHRPGKPSIGLLSASGALLLAVYLQKANSFELNQIYYKGGGPTVQDLLAGVIRHVDHHARRRASALPGRQAQAAGDRRATSARPRCPMSPRWPEQGLKTYPTYFVVGCLRAGPARPPPIVERMHAELAKAVQAADVRQKFTEQIDMEILGTTPAEFAAFQKTEQERWFKVIRTTTSRQTEPSCRLLASQAAKAASRNHLHCNRRSIRSPATREECLGGQNVRIASPGRAGRHCCDVRARHPAGPGRLAQRDDQVRRALSRRAARSIPIARIIQAKLSDQTGWNIVVDNKAGGRERGRRRRWSPRRRPTARPG
jgi:hypothetical protein